MVAVSCSRQRGSTGQPTSLSACFYVVSVVVSILGETWVHFILGSVVEVALLLTIARVAWAWPSRPAGTPADKDGVVVAPPSSPDRVLGEL